MQDVHHLESVLTSRDHVYRITFSDGEVFTVTNCVPTDTYLQDSSARWNCTIVSVSDVTSDVRRDRFQPGGGLDFLEGDVHRVFDLCAGVSVFEKGI